MTKKVQLILSSGGARGLAQIGVIQTLDSHGFQIEKVAGSSIGALIGGFYAAGKLDVFTEWVKDLNRMDVMRYFDVHFNSRGFIKGKKIMKELEKMLGNPKIEDLPIQYKAVSSDIISHEPVWFDKGSLLEAIRASISIPGVFIPVKHNGGMLVDGAIATPLPMNAFDKVKGESMVAVNLNAMIEYKTPVDKPDEKEREGLVEDFYQWRDKAMKLLNFKKDKSDKKPGMYGVLFRSFEMMQESYTLELIKTYKPDVLVELSRESADTFEFNKAEELIAYGREQTEKVLHNA
jgi:NTE family protein